MRFITWNIRHGGKDPKALAQAVAELDPDIVALTEFRGHAKGLQLVQELKAGGFAFATFTSPSVTNGVLVCAKTEVVVGCEPAPPDQAHRWCHVAIEGLGVELVGIYLPVAEPGNPNRLIKQQFWDHLLAAADRLKTKKAIIVGDFNTGAHRIDEEGSTFFSADSFVRLGQSGWTDAFRAVHGDRREYSWWSQARGFRLDHAFLSPSLKPHLKDVRYVHATQTHRLVQPMPRRAQKGRDLAPTLSDHAALIVEIDL